MKCGDRHHDASAHTTTTTAHEVEACRETVRPVRLRLSVASIASSRLADSQPPVSWTGFVIATLARAVAPYPQSNARRAGNRVPFFDGVDVGATVERHTDGGVVPVVVTIR